MPFQNNVIKEKFPFSLSEEGCFVIIKNGLSGTIKIKKQSLGVHLCETAKSVFCDGGDARKDLVVIDLLRTRTAFTKKIASLDYKAFGFATEQELVDRLTELAGRDVEVECCINCTVLSGGSKSVLCGANTNTEGEDGNDGGTVDPPVVIPPINSLFAENVETGQFQQMPPANITESLNAFAQGRLLGFANDSTAPMVFQVDANGEVAYEYLLSGAVTVLPSNAATIATIAAHNNGMLLGVVNDFTNSFSVTTDGTDIFVNNLDSGVIATLNPANVGDTLLHFSTGALIGVYADGTNGFSIWSDGVDVTTINLDTGAVDVLDPSFTSETIAALQAGTLMDAAHSATRLFTLIGVQQ